MLVEVRRTARIAAVTPGEASPPRRTRPSRRADAARPRERPLARVPARAARPHPARHAARSGPGASRCTRSPSGSTRTPTSRSRARPTPRWRWPASRPSASSTTCTTRPSGTPYDDPNAMGRALLAAAAEAGMRITLIDACYLHGGIGDAAGGGAATLLRRDARRRGPSGWTTLADERVGARGRGDPQRPRGRSRTRRATVAAWARERGAAAARARVRAARRERGVPRRIRAHAHRPAGRCGRARRALHRHPRHPPRRRRRGLLGEPAPAAACARRRSATSRTASAGCGRWSDAGVRLAFGSDSHAAVPPPRRRRPWLKCPAGRPRPPAAACGRCRPRGRAPVVGAARGGRRPRPASTRRRRRGGCRGPRWKLAWRAPAWPEGRWACGRASRHASFSAVWRHVSCSGRSCSRAHAATVAAESGSTARMLWIAAPRAPTRSRRGRPPPLSPRLRAPVGEASLGEKRRVDAAVGSGRPSRGNAHASLGRRQQHPTHLGSGRRTERRSACAHVVELADGRDAGHRRSQLQRVRARGRCPGRPCPRARTSPPAKSRTSHSHAGATRVSGRSRDRGASGRPRWSRPAAASVAGRHRGDGAAVHLDEHIALRALATPATPAGTSTPSRPPDSLATKALAVEAVELVPRS